MDDGDGINRIGRAIPGRKDDATGENLIANRHGDVLQRAAHVTQSKNECFFAGAPLCLANLPLGLELYASVWIAPANGSFRIGISIDGLGAEMNNFCIRLRVRKHMIDDAILDTANLSRRAARQ